MTEEAADPEPEGLPDIQGVFPPLSQDRLSETDMSPVLKSVLGSVSVPLSQPGGQTPPRASDAAVIQVQTSNTSFGPSMAQRAGPLQNLDGGNRSFVFRSCHVDQQSADVLLRPRMQSAFGRLYFVQQSAA